MFKFFYEGGPVFMGLLTLILLVVLILGVSNAMGISRGVAKSKGNLAYIKSVGLFGLVCGVLGQLIGLYNGFSVIQQIGDVSPPILIGGIKVSMITTIYGLIIFLIAYLIWFALSAWQARARD